MDNSKNLCRAFEALGAEIINKEGSVKYWQDEYDKMADRCRELERENGNLQNALTAAVAKNMEAASNE